MGTRGIRSRKVDLIRSTNIGIYGATTRIESGRIKPLPPKPISYSFLIHHATSSQPSNDSLSLTTTTPVVPHNHIADLYPLSHHNTSSTSQTLVKNPMSKPHLATNLSIESHPTIATNPNVNISHTTQPNSLDHHLFRLNDAKNPFKNSIVYLQPLSCQTPSISPGLSE
ncbi:unnamed protein product [Dovyalis caffra]|uniref:Uncharacterized protein n=1 Tax=Dovyalis caffra TaxID=77055 RepID=A0AAV1R179_9ROSI|nr:unnamed protein product [Dovyalis caffra]